jgi:periplasmic protein TonB
MLQDTPKPNGSASGNAVRPDRQRRRLSIAIILLLCALIVVLIKDHTYWFGGEETSAPEEQEQQVSPAPSTPAEAPAQAPATPATAPAAKPTKHVSTKHAAQPSTGVSVTSHPAAATSEATNTLAKPAVVSKSVSKPSSPKGETAAERVQMASIKAPLPADYPLLAGQMSVQGSVLLQVLIAANGAVDDVHVLSGPTILVSAAREAVRQWRFKPFYENGKAVETQARVTVNFTINVSNTTARNQTASTTSEGAI